jgi:hypothetical protein
VKLKAIKEILLYLWELDPFLKADYISSKELLLKINLENMILIWNWKV